MEEDRLFKKYTRRLRGIGLRKSFLWALALGFAFEFAAAFIIWFFHFSVLISVLVMAGTVLAVTLAATPVVYFLFYRPTTARVARMIDKLGLEERFVTMCEHEGDPSSVAVLQREDAQKKLEKVSEKRFFFRLSRVGALCLSLSVLFGLAMGILSAVSAGGLIPGADEIFSGEENEEANQEEEGEGMCIIVYVAGEGGTIGGEAVQRLEKGENTSPVTAIPDMGYEFAGWSDGDPRATRVDYNVQESLTLTAMFVKKAEVELPEVPGGGGSDEGGPGGDVNSGDAGLGGGAGGSGNSGEMEGDDVNGDSGGGAGAMKDKEDNSVIDGASDYKYVFDYETEIEALLKNETLSDEVKDFLNHYLDALKQMQEADKNA